jgi:glycosyltransferase involved in cell wall biosynthesis
LADAEVYARMARNIVFELRAKWAGLRDWSLFIARNEWFQKVAAARLARLRQSDNPRTVMAYSYAALEIFRLARARGWRTVLGQIDPGPPEERIVAKLYQEYPAWRGSWVPAPHRYWSAWRQECALADRIVVNSAWSRQALVEEGISPIKVKVIPLAYGEPSALAGFRRAYPARFTLDRPLRVLFLGQINLRKGIRSLLGAARLLRGEPVEFQMVGPVQVPIPPDMRYEPQVCWFGQVAREDTARYYQNADVLLFPTLSDGFGLTQLEAQAWKLPIIASKFCGEVVQNDKNGWILADVTAEAISAILRRVLNAPACLQKASVESKLVPAFELANVGRRWLELFD